MLHCRWFFEKNTPLRLQPGATAKVHGPWLGGRWLVPPRGYSEALGADGGHRGQKLSRTPDESTAKGDPEFDSKGRAAFLFGSQHVVEIMSSLGRVWKLSELS